MKMLPLKGIKVLDISQFLSGPWTTVLLGDMGAEVIKLEPKVGEAMRLYTYMNSSLDAMLSLLHRNKKGITLDIRSEKGKEVFKDLIKKVDVLIENFTSGVMEKLGLGYDVLKEINPQLIYTSISGFGRSGPYHNKPAFDIIAQATSGIMYVAERVDKQPVLFFADTVAGIFGALGTVVALYFRNQTGKGQLVDISMQDVMYAINNQAVIKRLFDDIFTEDEIVSMGIKGQDATNIKLPLYNSYPTKDGYIAIVAITDRQVRRLLKIMGKETLARKKEFRNIINRFKNIDIIDKTVSEWTKNKTTDELVKLLDSVHIPNGPVYNLEQVNKDPQLEARNMFYAVDHKKFGKIKIPGVIIKMSESPGSIRTPAPQLGEYNDEIYSDFLGYDNEKIKKLKKEGII